MGSKIGPIALVFGDYTPNYVDECTITVRGKLLTMNDVLGKNGKAVGRIKKQEQTHILLAWKNANYPRVLGRYKVHLHIVTSTKKDPSNLSGWAYKSLLDALGMRHTGGHGVIEDDGWKYHVSDSCSYEYTKGKNKTDYIKITFTACKAGTF